MRYRNVFPDSHLVHPFQLSLCSDPAEALRSLPAKRVGCWVRRSFELSWVQRSFELFASSVQQKPVRQTFDEPTDRGPETVLAQRRGVCAEVVECYPGVKVERRVDQEGRSSLETLTENQPRLRCSHTLIVIHEATSRMNSARTKRVSVRLLMRFGQHDRCLRRPMDTNRGVHRDPLLKEPAD